MPWNLDHLPFAAFRSRVIYIQIKALICLLLCVSLTSLQAQGERWSDPASWNGGSVPAAFEKVVIPEGKQIILDVSPAPMSTLTIEGELIFEDKDLTLIVGAVSLKGGLLQIGTEAQPFQHTASMTFIKSPQLTEGGFSPKKELLISEGGLLQIFGKNTSPTWTRSSVEMVPGDTLLTPKDKVQWPVDAEIVVASSSFVPAEAETGLIYNQYGEHMSISTPLAFKHEGKLLKKKGRSLDQRTEIGLLSHNVIIQGDQGAAYSQTGPSIRVKNTGRIQVEGAEFRFMGNKEMVDGIAIKFEESRSDTTSFIRKSSLHHFSNRGILVNAAHKLAISENVFFKMKGNGIILNNQEDYPMSVKGNLMIHTESAADLLPDVRLPKLANAGIWMLHGGYNVYKNIVSGTMKGSGFYIHELWKHSKGALGRRFIGNTAHGNQFNDGENALNPEANAGHGLHIGFTQKDSLQLGALLTDFTAYRNAVAGVWADVSHLDIKRSIFKNNSLGIALPSASVEDCLFWGPSGIPHPDPLLIAEAPNAIRFRGDISTGENIVVCKSSFYDFPRGSIYVQHSSMALLAVLYELDWINSTPLHYEDLQIGGMVDLDGSTSGGRGMIVGGDLSLQHSQCEFIETWNAFNCELGPYIFLQVTESEGQALPEWELSGLYGKVVSRQKGVAQKQSSFLISNSLYQLNWKENSPKEVVLDLEGSPGSYLQLSLAYPEQEEVWLEIDGDIYLPSYRNPNVSKDKFSYRWLEELQALDVFVRLGEKGKERLKIRRAKKAPFGSYEATLTVKNDALQFRFAQKEIKDITSYQLLQKKENGLISELETRKVRKRDVSFSLPFPEESWSSYRIKCFTKSGKVYLSPWITWGDKSDPELSLK